MVIRVVIRVMAMTARRLRNSSFTSICRALENSRKLSSQSKTSVPNGMD